MVECADDADEAGKLTLNFTNGDHRPSPALTITTVGRRRGASLSREARAPGPVDNLRLTTLALPPERDGWVRIRVEAFGLNRSELKLRLGLSAGVSFPLVPGIEAVGTVDAAPAGSGLDRGQKAVAMMGDMGRVYDGPEQVPQAHDDMEHDRATGKLAVRVRH